MRHYHRSSLHLGLHETLPVAWTSLERFHRRGPHLHTLHPQEPASPPKTGRDLKIHKA